MKRLIPSHASHHRESHRHVSAMAIMSDVVELLRRAILSGLVAVFPRICHSFPRLMSIIVLEKSRQSAVLYLIGKNETKTPTGQLRVPKNRAMYKNYLEVQTKEK
jgi:hypothetical protein